MSRQKVSNDVVDLDSPAKELVLTLVRCPTRSSTLQQQSAHASQVSPARLPRYTVF